VKHVASIFRVEEYAKYEISIKQVAVFLAGLFFDHENGGDIFFGNIC
jgi:hypothetical protein